MRRTFTFTDPDGGKHKRTSATRTYTHAILSRVNGPWKLETCIGRPDLVAARLETWGKGSPDVIAVPCD
jgi:hypothetical protein